MTDTRFFEYRLLPNEEGSQPEYPAELVRWFQLCEKYRFLWCLTSPTLNQTRPPKPLRTDEFLSLIGSLKDPRHGPILAELIFELIGPEILKLVKASTRRKRK